MNLKSAPKRTKFKTVCGVSDLRLRLDKQIEMPRTCGTRIL
jgi:hypothetical protein